MKKEDYIKYSKEILDLFDKANIILRNDEKANLEIADFGLDNFESEGLSLITYVNTDLVCAKEIALLPGQTCPEHRHPPRGFDGGKEETFRCRYGKIYLYVEGEETKNRVANPPKNNAEYYTVFNEIILNPGEQYTLKPNTKHWFQGGEEGGIVSEFSSKSTDDSDIFTNKKIKRAPVIE